MSQRRFLLFVLIPFFLVTAGFVQTIGNQPHSRHVVVVMEENRSISIASEYMPYLRALAAEYSQGMQVYSDSHGSWLAYGELTSGMAPFGGQGDGGICNGDGCTRTVTIDNLVREFAKQGISWRAYFQTMPQEGYLGYQYGEYVRRHNPFAFYSDVVNSLLEPGNMYPADPYMLSDIEANRLANFTWISPDLDHDAHNGSNDQQALAAADAYLQTFMPQLLQSQPFQTGGDGVLMITFDEGELSGDNGCGGYPDANNCGGHIWHVLIGPQVNRGYESDTLYKQGSELRLICDLLGVNSCPGDGATSAPMTEFFQGTPQCRANQDRSVAICSPQRNGGVKSPVQFSAAAKDNQYRITSMMAYANGQIVAQSPDGTLNAKVPLSPGSYQLVVRAWDTKGYYFSSQENFTVTSGSSEATQPDDEQ